MEERKRIFVFLGVAVLLLVIVIVVVVSAIRNRPSGGQFNEPINQVGQIPVFDEDDTSPTNTVLPPPPVQEFPEEDSAERYARQVSKIFVERFGSYSSHNNNSHLDDVLGMLTPSMANWVATQRVSAADGFYSQTTNLISSEIRSFEEESAAVVSVGAQQVIEDGNGKRTAYKNGRVELLFVDGDWKIDGLYWE